MSTGLLRSLPYPSKLKLQPKVVSCLWTGQSDWNQEGDGRLCEAEEGRVFLSEQPLLSLAQHRHWPCLGTPALCHMLKGLV